MFLVGLLYMRFTRVSLLSNSMVLYITSVTSCDNIELLFYETFTSDLHIFSGSPGLSLYVIVQMAQHIDALEMRMLNWRLHGSGNISSRHDIFV
jgi:hypothetical protein